MTLIDRSDSLLIVVDTQPGFVSHNARNELESQAAEAALERLVWLAGIASLLEIPAIVVEAEPDRYGSTEPHLLGRLPPDTPVFARTTFGLAASPEIVTAIRAAGRNTAVLVGFETDVCVAQSAIGLATSACVRWSWRTRPTPPASDSTNAAYSGSPEPAWS
jgi:nicotinamidase-related amidase